MQPTLTFSGTVRIDTDGYLFKVGVLPDFEAFVPRQQGKTIQDALAAAEVALASFADDLLSRGESLPTEDRGGAADFRDWLRKITETNVESATRVELVALGYRSRTAAPVRINISLAPANLERIDAAATARGMSRSAYICAAALAYA